jgi:Peptidase family M28
MLDAANRNSKSSHSRNGRSRTLIAGLVTLVLHLNPVHLASQSSSFDSRPGQTAPIPAASSIKLDREVRADMAFLAGDALRGRGSATRDEHIAALFAAAQFAALGLAPGGDNGAFVQTVALPKPLPREVQQRLSRFEDTPRTETWNAVAILRGTGFANGRPEEAILLSAHLDHLGVGPANAAGDTIYNGADDDASGTTAVLALAQALADSAANGQRPRRTIVFALFGSEELGGFGSAGFLAHPPVPLSSIVANLEFEMIGRPDPAIAADALWLTGFDRSNLGPELARHGARLVADPHPRENFFQRSDNYGLARQGIVAHTVSSFGLHKDYHQPSDELNRIDFSHLTGAIASMIDPIRWLADTTFRPSWNPGRKP